MAITELQRRGSGPPTTPRKRLAGLFSFSKSAASITSFSNQLPPPTPSHSFSESMMEENIENAETMITKWDLNSPSVEKFTSLFQENRKEAKEFIKCVKGLRRAMHFLVAEHPSSAKLVLAQNLMQMAMKRLEREFYQILKSNREHLKPESVSSHSSNQSGTQSYESEEEIDIGTGDEIQMAGESFSEAERLTLRALSNLRLIADCMMSTGYSKECVKIYTIIRKSIVSETMFNLGIERYSSSQINKMTSEDLEHHIKNWLSAIKIAVKELMHGEKFLCDHVFSISETIKETCFTDIGKEGAINLFRFPEYVAKSKRSSDKVFLLMDLYAAIQDLWPDIESIFSYESIAAVKLQAHSSLQKLGDSVKLIISEFESSIQKNSSRTPVPGGGIHPLTNSVLQYVTTLAHYSEILCEIVTDAVPPGKLPFPESYFESPSSHDSPTSAFSIRLAWIILVLLCKLDSKAELYNDVSLCYLFLANNLQFIAEKVRTTTLKDLLGYDWVAKLDTKVKSYYRNYEAMAWTKVLSCLPQNSVAEMPPDMVKAHFNNFNAAFEEAYQKQMSWVVPDGKHRNEIKLSIARKLVPAYQEFYSSHFATLVEEKNFEVLERFSPDNLGNYLSDLFHGTSVSGSSSLSRPHGPRCLP